jgi:HK97 family phage major capsid protein
MDIQSRIVALNTTRLKAWEQGKALLDTVGTREMSAEERAEWDRINSHINDIDAEVRDLVEVEQREREAATLREATFATFGEQRVAQQTRDEIASFRSWMASGGAGEFEIDIRAAARERELLRQGASGAELRALAWDASSGSLVVPTAMARSLYEYLEAAIAGFRIGATTLNTSTGENIQLPLLKTHAIGTQVATQNLAIGGTDPVFSQVTLSTYKYGELIQLASELVADSAFDIESWVGRELGYAIGRVVDADLVVGTGTSEPKGMTVLTGAGTNAPVTTGGSLIAPTVEKFIDTVYSVNDAARAKGGAWLMKDSVAGTVRKLRDGAGGTVGAFLWQPSLTQGIITGQPDQFLGYPVYTDPNCAAAGSNSTLATFGDFSQYVVRTVGNPVIERSTEYGFNTDSVYFRGKWRIGGNHTAVSHLNNLVQNV